MFIVGPTCSCLSPKKLRDYVAIGLNVKEHWRKDMLIEPLDSSYRLFSVAGSLLQPFDFGSVAK